MQPEQPDVPDLSRTHATARDAVSHAITQMEAALSNPIYKITPGNQAYEEMRRDMPYIIHETGIDGVQILLNRNYNPVGSNEPTEGKLLNYEDYTNLQVRLSAKQIASVTSPPHNRRLLDDGNSPWRGRHEAKAYVARLQQLLWYLS